MKTLIIVQHVYVSVAFFSKYKTFVLWCNLDKVKTVHVVSTKMTWGINNQNMGNTRGVYGRTGSKHEEGM